MPSTAVDIVNLALARLGDEANVASISPPEGSAQATHAARFYPIARDTLLEMHPWKFATRRAQPALRSDLSFTSWQFIYQEPANLIRVLSVLPSGYTRDDQPSVEFATESDANGLGLILTNDEDVTIRGIYRVNSTALFTPLFTEALSWLLASYLAGPLIKGDTGAAEGVRCYQAFLAMFARATGSSAGQMKLRQPHMPEWMAAHGSAIEPEVPARG